MKLSQFGEFALIRRLSSLIRHPTKGILCGPGDDCAVVRAGGQYQLLTADMLIEGVHFRRDWSSPAEIGFKAMRVNLSDIAAMGGRPRFALVSVGLPRDFSVAEAENLYRGLQRAASGEGVVIAGGDTNRANHLTVNVAVIGEMKKRPLLRSGARVGDSIYVTGTLGGSALGLEALRRHRHRGYEKFIRRHKCPPSRVAVGRFLARKAGVHSLIDLSDGLAGDLGHILEQSHAGAEIHLACLPVMNGVRSLELALCGGEDYELLFTASPRVKMPNQISGVPVTLLGRITPKAKGLRWLNEKGRPLKFAFGGFQHWS